MNCWRWQKKSELKKSSMTGFWAGEGKDPKREPGILTMSSSTAKNWASEKQSPSWEGSGRSTVKKTGTELKKPTGRLRTEKALR